jgi:glycerol kinase
MPLGSGLWRSLDAVAERHTIERSFRPSADPTARAEGYAGWRRAVERARDWTA